jgi:trimethylamine--corrinoid protein Co-methyltransferase
MDAQMGHEKTLTALVPALAGVSVIYGVGMIDGGISMCYDELIADCEFIRMVRKVAKGVEVNDETLAVDVIKNVGPVGNFLGQRHTLKHVRELSLPRLFDRRSRESWEKDGSTTIQERAHIKALEHFAEHKAPELDPQIVAKLDKIISDAEAELDTDI